MKTAATIVVTLLAVSMTALVQARTWSEAGSDRTLEGDFVKVDGDNVVIRRSNGTTVNVPLAKLSEPDQTFVKEQTAPKELEIPEEGVVLSGVHLCCGGCKRGVDNALADIKDIKYTVDTDAETVTFAKASSSLIQEAMNALAAKGYYGISDLEELQIADVEISDKKADSVEVNGVHLCCGSCVKAVTRAMENVDGYESHDAAKDAETFVVSGKNISPSDVLAALRAEGLSGTVK